jgi:hypothetical protein
MTLQSRGEGMIRVLSALLVLGLLVSCSGKKQENAKSEGGSAANSAQGEPTQAIPSDDTSEFDQLMEAKIVPYFDADGTVTEKAVSPGDNFDLYVFGEYNEMYPMSAAEYMLVLPTGMEILTEAKSDSAVMSVGSFKTDYMMTFRCSKGPKFMMMKYACRVSDAFAGGDISTQAGSVHHFLGFTLCDDARTMVKAQPGKAVLTKK